MILAHGVLQKHWQIVDDSVASTQLLENLRRRTDKHTTEMLGATTSEQVREFGLLAHGTGTILRSVLACSVLFKNVEDNSRLKRLEDKMFLKLGFMVMDLATT